MTEANKPNVQKDDKSNQDNDSQLADSDPSKKDQDKQENKNSVKNSNPSEVKIHSNEQGNKRQ